MTTQKLLTHPQIPELHPSLPPETIITPELVEAVDAAFTGQVETLEAVDISPEQENELGAIYKPVIANDWTKGARN